MSHKIRNCVALTLALLSSAAWGQTREQPKDPAKVQPDVLFVARGAAMDCTARPFGPAPGTAGAQFEIGKPITGAPYSGLGTTEVVQTLADGNRIVRKNTMRYFRDGHGRTRTEYALSAMGPFTLDEARSVVMINDPVANQRYVLHPNLRRATALPGFAHFGMMADAPMAAGVITSSSASANLLVAPAPAGVVFAPAGCAPFTRRLPEPVALGERKIEGVRVVGSRSEFQIAAGEIGNEQPIRVRSEQWFSPELGVVIESTHNDPMVGETRYKLEQISRGEPEASLFKPPTDYVTETLPSPPAPRPALAPQGATPANKP